MILLVFPDIVIRPVLLIHVGSLKARVRHILLVDAPAHLGGLEEIDDGLRIGVDALEVVIDDTEGASTASRHVVWLRRVRYGVVIAEQNALRREIR